MILRNRADRRTLLWAFGFMPGALAVQYVWPQLAGWLAPVSIYLAYCAGVIAHNHNHSPTFKSRRANHVMSAWVSFFYGFPILGWIPTHNENHHKFTNGEGDATRTTIWSTRDTAWDAFVYFFRSSAAQAPAIKSFLRKTREKNPRLYAAYLFQYVAVIGGHLGCWALAVVRFGPGRGTFVYASALGVPSLLALWGLMFTNYLQHVGCDPKSDWNHSRNFVSPTLNYLIFDNGFHTVHHEKPGQHWSLNRAAHERVEKLMDPRVNENDIFSYCFRTYVLGRRRPGFTEGFATNPHEAYESPLTP